MSICLYSYRVKNPESCILPNKNKLFEVNLLSRVLYILFHLLNVQNRAIPKPPFNRVFQGGTGRGTNASIQKRPKC